MKENIFAQRWRPKASIEILKLRSEFIARIRNFFINNNYWEVETPIACSAAVTDQHLRSVEVIINKKKYYLHTSPEYYMKRLIAADSGSIFQIAKVFRDEEEGKWHAPEFTMLEWYKVGVTQEIFIAELNLLFQHFLQTDPLKILTYQEVFRLACNFDPFEFSYDSLIKVLKKYNLDHVSLSHHDLYNEGLFLLMSHVVEPYLSNINIPVLVRDFPPEQAGLSRILGGKAQRFEVYYKGIELVNGFDELTDYQEQIQRFDADNLNRKLQDLDLVNHDELFIEALKHGMPACVGAALGFDRFFALYCNRNSIHDIVAF